MPEQENDQFFAPPDMNAALEVVKSFLRMAVDLVDPNAARMLMTAESNTIPAFDPRGLAGKTYKVGEPILDEDAVIVPVEFRDDRGLTASMPIVVILENGVARLDIASTMELMLGGEVNFVEGISPDDLNR